MCKLHYYRWYRAQGGPVPKPSIEERFWAKVAKRGPSECWTWTASADEGYGRFRIHGKWDRAHRVAYELVVGPIGAGLEIDHLCRNHSCVNPAHLEAVTRAENVRRWAATISTCKHGHPLNEANTAFRRSNGTRICRTCSREAVRRYVARRKAALT